MPLFSFKQVSCTAVQEIRLAKLSCNKAILTLRSLSTDDGDLCIRSKLMFELSIVNYETFLSILHTRILIRFV